MAVPSPEPWLHWSSPQERAELLQALGETRHTSNAAWLEEVLQHAQEALDLPASTGEAPADLVRAAQAAAAGDWRQAGLLYRQRLRPPSPQPDTHAIRTPGSR